MMRQFMMGRFPLTRLKLWSNPTRSWFRHAGFRPRDNPASRSGYHGHCRDGLPRIVLAWMAPIPTRCRESTSAARHRHHPLEQFRAWRLLSRRDAAPGDYAAVIEHNPYERERFKVLEDLSCAIDAGRLYFPNSEADKYGLQRIDWLSATSGASMGRSPLAEPMRLGATTTGVHRCVLVRWLIFLMKRPERKGLALA